MKMRLTVQVNIEYDETQGPAMGFSSTNPVEIWKEQQEWFNEGSDSVVEHIMHSDNVTWDLDLID